MLKEQKTATPVSKEVAKERLKNILMRDRVDISPEIIGQIKEDMLSVAEDYFTLEQKGNAEVYLTNMKKNSNASNETILVCLVPISKLRGQTGQTI